MHQVALAGMLVIPFCSELLAYTKTYDDNGDRISAAVLFSGAACGVGLLQMLAWRATCRSPETKFSHRTTDKGK